MSRVHPEAAELSWATLNQRMEHVTTRSWAAALAVFLLFVSAGAWALGLGNIEVGSTLNEPLRARIELKSLQSGDLEGMQVQLAGADQFKRAGIQRPFQLSKLKFSAVEGASGDGHIDVTTRGAVVVTRPLLPW